jgi:hypothetical protein
MSILGGKEKLPSIKREIERLDEEEARKSHIDLDQGPEVIADQFIEEARKEWGPNVYLWKLEDGGASEPASTGSYFAHGLSLRSYQPSNPDIKSYSIDSPEGREMFIEHWRQFKEERDEATRTMSFPE